MSIRLAFVELFLASPFSSTIFLFAFAPVGRELQRLSSFVMMFSL